MKISTGLMLTAALSFLGATGISAAPTDTRGFDISKFAYKGRPNSNNILESQRMKMINKTNDLLEKGMPSRFANYRNNNADTATPLPSQVFTNSDLMGDMDGPDGRLWFYAGEVEYKIEEHEYFTEQIPVGASFTVYNAEMQEVGSIRTKFKLKDDEARVRTVSVLPIVTRNFFNDDDKYEVVLNILVNPLPYGIRPYTFVYSLGNPRDEEGNDVPVKTINRMINDVCSPSDGDNSNMIITFLQEGNDSGVTEAELKEDDKYWQYQMGNYIKMESYAKADAQGELQKVFEKRMTYLQTQGNQQDDAPMMTYVRNGKPHIIWPRYEEVFYNPYTMQSDMSQRQPNNLLVDIYEYVSPTEGFKNVQTTTIPVVKAADESVIASYYGIGSFRYTGDILYGDDGKASFIVTRTDLLGNSDSEARSYFIYGPDGTVKSSIYANTASQASLSDLEGFDPMAVFVTMPAQNEYVFNFTNLRTMETELSLNWGLKTDDSDDPDYIMANMDRVKVGDTFMYVAEMRMPEYDDVNDINFSRVVWLTRDGKIDHFDYINMGDMVNYATLYLSAATLDPNYFHESPQNEYAVLIKRALSEDSKKTEEQLLIAQARSEEHPLGQDLLLLRPHEEYGNLATIIPYDNPNRLSVSYYKTVDKKTTYTTVYYSLPFNKGEGSGIQSVATPEDHGFFSFDGRNVIAEGALIEVFNLQGMAVAKGCDTVSLAEHNAGVYIVRVDGKSAKIYVK